MVSYHDEIGEAARKIEEERGKLYNDKTPQKKITWSRAQLAFLQAIQYKACRLEIFSKDITKAYDDIIDIYNFAALLFQDLKRGERGEPQN